MSRVTRCRCILRAPRSARSETPTYASGPISFRTPRLRLPCHLDNRVVIRGLGFGIRADRDSRNPLRTPNPKSQSGTSPRIRIPSPDSQAPTNPKSQIPNPERPPSTRRAYLAWIAVCLIWGTTYLGIRIALETIPPFLMGAARWIVAGLLIIGILIVRRERLPPMRSWG